MAITNFIPEVWSAEVLLALRAQLVFAQSGLINRDYEGDISQAGDTVHIIGVGDPGIRSYTVGSDITWDALTDSDTVLTIDQQKYFAFVVDDVNKRQAAGDFAAAAAVNTAFGMASAVDTFVSGLMQAAAPAGNTLGTGAAPIAINSATAPTDMYDKVLVPLRTLLSKSNVPTSGRWAAVSSDQYGCLLRDSRFIKVNESGGDQGLRNGIVGRAAGFDIYESQTLPTNVTTTKPVALAGHPMATTYADDLVEMDAIRLENRFADGIKGLHVYGGKVVRPSALAMGIVTVS